MSGRRALDGETWRALVHDPDARQTGSVPQVLLAQLGDECRRSPALWQRFLEAVRGHLESKAVRLATLGREIEWLQRHQPAGERLLPPVRLAWLVAQLEQANHQGQASAEVDEELQALGQSLLDEEPALVCQADLDRAVQATNCFDFARASAALDRWQSLPVCAPGLQRWARVESSLGQHAAFRGALAEAQRRFSRALEAFARLSDPELARQERRHTASYLAITALDDPGLSLDEVRRWVGEVVSLRTEEIRQLARSRRVDDKYPHHLLLRYLVQRGSEAERRAYLAEAESWDVGLGHPWELIQFYRGCLLRPTDPTRANALFGQACELAVEEPAGATLRLIGATLATVAAAWGADCRGTAGELDELTELLPAAAPRIARLREAQTTPPADPWALLAEVLPFNFR